MPPPATNVPVTSIAINQSSGLGSLMSAAEANPQVMATLQAAFGNSVAAAQKSPWGMLLGFALGALATRFGVTADPGIVTLAGGILAVLGGDVWQWASARIRTRVTP